MPRPRKFKMGEVAKWGRQPVVIVDWRSDDAGRGEYRIVRTLGLTGKAFGPARWLDSNQIDRYRATDKRPWYMRPTVLRTVRANIRLGDDHEDRGCTCNCCPHVAIPAGVIRQDGTIEGD